MTVRPKLTTKAVSLLAASVLSLSLAACSNDDGGDTDASDAAATSEAAEDTSTSAADGDEQDGNDEGGNDAAAEEGNEDWDPKKIGNQPSTFDGHDIETDQGAQDYVKEHGKFPDEVIEGFRQELKDTDDIEVSDEDLSAMSDRVCSLSMEMFDLLNEAQNPEDVTEEQAKKFQDKQEELNSLLENQLDTELDQEQFAKVTNLVWVKECPDVMFAAQPQ